MDHLPGREDINETKRVVPHLPPSVTDLFEGAAVQLVPEVEGNRIIDGRLAVGMRAGPSLSVSNLLHEMAHFVEIDDRRCGMAGWGLKTPRVLMYTPHYGHPVYDSFKTAQHIEREIRVCAFQANAGAALGVALDVEELARPFLYLPDTWTYASDRELVKKVCSAIQRDRRRLTFEIFLAEWLRKNDLLARRYRKAGR